jgi:lysozyme
VRITEAQASGYLEKALTKFWHQIEPAMKIKPNEYQADAMLSLAYNIGPGAFKSSSVLRKWNAGDPDGAAASFALWNKGTVNGKKVVLKGLVRRREAERALFVRRTTSKPAALPTPKPAAKPSRSFWADFFAALGKLFGGK